MFATGKIVLSTPSPLHKDWYISLVDITAFLGFVVSCILCQIMGQDVCFNTVSLSNKYNDEQCTIMLVFNFVFLSN